MQPLFAVVLKLHYPGRRIKRHRALSRIYPLHLTPTETQRPIRNNQAFVRMAYLERAQEMHIRKALGLNSFDLAALERYLMQEGHVPNSTDDQALRDSVFNFRSLFNRGSPFSLNTPHPSLHDIFKPGPDATDVPESESAKYDTVRDLIRLLAVRKAQASATQEQQGWDAAAKDERAR